MDAILNKDVESVRTYIQHSPHLIDRFSGHHCPLGYAVEIGSLEIVQELLQAGANPNIEGIHTAAWKGYQEIVKELVKAGANVNKLDAGGMTPLMLAAMNGHLEVVKMLIDLGADPLAEDEYEETALDKAELRAKDRPRRQQIMEVITYLEHLDPDAL